jgi:hypothetical protein
MDAYFYTDIPTWENGKWTTTSFATREAFASFVVHLFKEPGQYGFDATSSVFNEQARAHDKQGFYCAAPKGTKDFIAYWDDQKVKCRKGAIYKSGDKTWYLPREYYMWLNFLKINNKIKKKIVFPDVMDVQYHMALYELLAELHYKHCAILKKRQIASSYYHCAKLINLIWFEETPILKMGAALADQINLKGSWKFLVEYKDFLNEHTAWKRAMNPGGVWSWQQQIETNIGNIKVNKGLKGVLMGMSFERNATNGVGGDCRVFFHEEAGVAPKMDETFEFIRPSLSFGDITTGTFIAAGSVGDLDQCEPLKQMILSPETSDIYPVHSNLLDENWSYGVSGLFLPEQWSMPPYIDEFGNSKVEEALKAILAQREEWKKTLSPEKYQLRISQRPINIAEAFAFRKVSPFPIHLVTAQEKRIEEKTYAMEYLDIDYDAVGKVQVKPSNKLPISEFPITKKTENKEGVLVVFERPDKDAEIGTYYASIDPVSEGKTNTSESLCSITVGKNAVEVTKITDEGPVTYIEQAKIVASWCGRFDDINKTHERLLLILEWYNAQAIVENNVSLFINYMILKNKQRYLVQKSQILFLKDLKANDNVFQEYGWKNVGTIFSSHLLSYGIEFMKEVIDEETAEDGTVVKRVYGVERIPDIMIMKEAKAYAKGVNVDRLVSYCSLVAFMKVQQANRGYRKRVERQEGAHLQKSDNLFKLDNKPFRHVGGQGQKNQSTKPVRRPFKNLR